MIVVDASALVAILLDEPEATRFREFLLVQSALSLSPIGYWEASTRLRVLRGDDGVTELNIVIDHFQIKITPASSQTAHLACTAEQRFGKRTPAKLNMGDCFAYALAKEMNAPLLFKGDDFMHTDITPALAA